MNVRLAVIALAAAIVAATVAGSAPGAGSRSSLYVASEDEPVGIADDARALHEATASTDKRLEIVPGRSHGLRILKSVLQTRTLVESFLRAH
jgi:hypothetical protein